jgi:hypothetical protein
MITEELFDNCCARVEVPRFKANESDNHVHQGAVTSHKVGDSSAFNYQVVYTVLAGFT